MYAANGVNVKKKERKVTLIFKHTTANQHVAGVEALAVSQDSSYLYTASRDSLVKRWRTTNRPECDVTFEGHVDWVNDVLVYQDKLVTCSSDRAVKIWQAGEEGRCLHTVQHHTDYVTCLAASPVTGKLLSAGLHSEVIMYDMETMQAHLLLPTPSKSSSMGGAPSSSGGMEHPDGYGGAQGGGGGGGGAPVVQAPVRSIYALAVNEGGTVVAAGTTESYIRLLDPRTGEKIMKLKGHSDNVRCLLLNPEGNLLLSGSSDNTVRLWDLGQQRCIQTLAVHTDSVWCLAASRDLSIVYSGGRDKNVYATHTAQRKAWLLAREQHPVRDVALSDGGSRLWVATTSATVHGYSIPPHVSGLQQQQQQQCQQQQPWRQQQQWDEPPDLPQHPGDASATQQEQTPRAHLSTQQDPQQPLNPEPLLSPGRHQGSDAQADAGFSGRGLGPSGSARAVFGTSPSLRLRHSMDPGGQPEDAPLLAPALTIPGSPGLVAVRVLCDKRHLLTQDATGEVQLWDVLAGRPIQQLGKVNMAQEAQRHSRPLYVESWFSADVKLGALAVHLDTPKCFAAEAYALDLGLHNVPDDQKVNLGACLLRSALSQWAHNFSRLFLSGAPLPGLDDPLTEQLPHFHPDLPPAVVSTSASGATWRTSASAFTGREREGEDLPAWVCDGVLRGLLPYVKELKAAFVLHPAEGSSLPSLMQSRLNAPRILQVMKVANYCVTKLSELNVPLCTHAVGLTPDTQQPPANGHQYLELTCNGFAVPYSFSIATVKRYIWKRSDDVIFNYRILDPNRLAPFPQLADS